VVEINSGKNESGLGRMALQLLTALVDYTVHRSMCIDILSLAQAC
jgi:hypothetical protein